MFRAVLSNPRHPEYGVATVPFPIKNEDYDQIIALLEPLEIGDAVRRDCWIDEIKGELPALKQMERTGANLDELDYLAKRLCGFDEYEKAQFQGMASHLGLHGADELINLTFCCQESTVITDFSDLEKLGRRHFLTMRGGVSPEEMQDRNFREIALALIESETGCVTPYGVAYENDMELAQVYDGQSVPQYRFEDCVMEIEMRHVLAPDDAPGTYLYLPMSQTQIDRAVRRAGLDDFDDVCLYLLESSLPEELDALLDMECEGINSLNELCRAVQPLAATDLEKLGAVVSLALPDQAGEITNLAKNLEQFDFVSKIRTPEEYGKYMIMESGHYDYDENLVGYIEFVRYGAERMEQERGQFVDRGYVAYQGTLSLNELMQGNLTESMGPQIKME